jgi:hypothetical protein
VSGVLGIFTDFFGMSWAAAGRTTVMLDEMCYLGLQGVGRL